MKRALLVTFAAVAYAWFLADIAWSIAFLADVGSLGISHGPSTPTIWAVLINLSLLGVFAVHHSVMAREGAKRLITRVVPAAAERSTYVLAAAALLALVLWQWRPIGGTVWDISAQPWQLLLWAGYGLGWLVAVAATFMIDHADFVGLRQAASRPGHYRPPVFREQWLYAWVRHPLMLGLLMAFWITPRMSMGHLLFAAASTAYIVIGTRLEEGALRRRYGSSYEDYATRVPALIPGPRRAMRSRATEVTR
ncbi:MAG TPA: isoprenylcysteine carboxylmethyltransferase family protein [Intrasporangium sp.]|uniref:methyltransferase family protein n=1 Tax=Intrasporangium sp. TaxID=1925024 RepID=UPI002B47AF39|nr:isoprenylcysteine carboxylmethyltransferase family protein [Intrasporangium sp.]HKX69020.1 isoprenylcysteine carboxylmethyltransferase family protein [Intrasporangium sp.]